MWDCVPLFDDNAKKAIAEAGGVKAIALSHPHFLATCVDVAEEFSAPIYMSEKDTEWISRPSDRYNLFSGKSFSNSCRAPFQTLECLPDSQG